MPINYLQPAKSFGPVEIIETITKKPFSKKALIFSILIGFIVSIAVIGILLIINNLKNQAKAEDISSSVFRDQSSKIIIDISTIDTDNDGIYDWAESDFGTDPYSSDTDFDGYSDQEEILHGYDPTGFGRPEMILKISKINVLAPIIFSDSKDKQDIQDAMSRGVAHYPDTAVPGAPGNIYITGHSSDFPWSKGEYKKIFRKLNNLEIGDRVEIVVKLNSGAALTHAYEIYDKQVLAVNAPELWQADHNGSVLTLVTSWPIDTTKERLMVRGVLVD